MRIDSERFKRGSLPPFISLAEAASLVTQIYEQAGGKANYDLLSQIFDNSQSSSSFVKKLAVLKAYGLVNEPTKGDVVVSDSGTAIAAPTSDEGSALAKKDAFLRIDVYNKIHGRHKGKLLPADEFLRNIIEHDCGIPRELSGRWTKEFKDGARTAGLLYDRGDGKMQLMESPVVPKVIAVGDSLRSDGPTTIPEQMSPPTNAGQQATTASNTSGSGMNIKIQLSDGGVAIFSVPDRIAARDAQKLKSALEGFGRLIDSLVQGE
jgi:hypothetical protein